VIKFNKEMLDKVLYGRKAMGAMEVINLIFKIIEHISKRKEESK